MSDSERKIFPIETVLALVTAKQDADLRAIAGYLCDRSIPCSTLAASVAPFAAAWVARLFPKFADLVPAEGEDWDRFVARVSAVLGDNVSLPAMAGSLKDACNAVIDHMYEKRDQVIALQAEVAKLSAELETLKPLPAKLASVEAARAKLEDQLKAQKKEMGGMRRDLMAFQGKMAVDQDELLDAIKNAIKDNLKSVTIAAGGAAAAGAAAGADVAAGAAEEPAAAEPEAEFGFGDSNGSSDGFGFGF